MTSLSEQVARVKELDAKRTQGAWEVTGYEIHNGIEHGEIVADLEFANTPEMNKANCSFIASAPQMAALVAQLWDEREQNRTVMEQALEALERCYDVNDWPANGTSKQDSAITSLKQALGR